jgi:hypothetical protein
MVFLRAFSQSSKEEKAGVIAPMGSAKVPECKRPRGVYGSVNQVALSS